MSNKGLGGNSSDCVFHLRSLPLPVIRSSIEARASRANHRGNFRKCAYPSEPSVSVPSNKERELRSAAHVLKMRLLLRARSPGKQV